MQLRVKLSVSLTDVKQVSCLFDSPDCQSGVKLRSLQSVHRDRHRCVFFHKAMRNKLKRKILLRIAPSTSEEQIQRAPEGKSDNENERELKKMD